MTATFIFRDDDLHSDFLQRKLIVNEMEQLKSTFVRHVIAPQFDAGTFADNFGMGGDHFAVEEKGSVGVEFLL